jgi:hypothetical protein
MSQHDYNLIDQPGASFRTDLNLVLDAILSMNSGSTEPATKSPYMLWADTTAGILKIRNAANSAWINFRSLSSSGLDVASGGTGGTTPATAKTGLDIESAGNKSLKVPAGSLALRDTVPAAGFFRFNTDSNQFEGYNGSAWGAVGGGATGGSGNAAFYENDSVISSSYTISTNKNAITAGPITINNGITVTVPNGSTWSII